MKHCPRCDKDKELDQFYKDKHRPGGLSCWCRECRREYQLHYHSRPGVKEQRKEYNTAYKELKPLQQRGSHLKRLYGISIEGYNRMFSDQQGCCAICKKHQSEFKKALAVDHCHETGQIRGLLCGGCNLAIGNAEDSIEILSAAIQYLSQKKG